MWKCEKNRLLFLKFYSNNTYICGVIKLWDYIVFFILILTVFDSFIHIFITLSLLHFNHLKEMLIVKNLK